MNVSTTMPESRCIYIVLCVFMQATSGAPAPKGGSFAQNVMNSQDATQPMTNFQPLTQSQLSMTAPSQPLIQTDLSQVQCILSYLTIECKLNIITIFVRFSGKDRNSLQWDTLRKIPDTLGGMKIENPALYITLLCGYNAHVTLHACMYIRVPSSPWASLHLQKR